VDAFVSNIQNINYEFENVYIKYALVYATVRNYNYTTVVGKKKSEILKRKQAIFLYTPGTMKTHFFTAQLRFDKQNKKYANSYK